MIRRATAALAGPLALARTAPIEAVLLLCLILLLTLVTQIGGAVLWFCVPAFAGVRHWLAGRSRPVRAGACTAVFLGAYLAVSLAVIPLAGMFGRAPLHCGLIGEADLGPRTALTCLLNRHYARLPAQQALKDINEGFLAENGDARTAYLDANFPLFDGFPMFPHLSHRDGRKIDLALIYADGAATPSPVGYWGFTQPRHGDPRPCVGREGWLRWDMDRLQPLLPKSSLDAARTRALVTRLAADPSVRRIFIEPHLAARLGLDHPKIRFQGCAAARHDDHIHVEFR